jgi:hypothetical protein
VKKAEEYVGDGTVSFGYSIIKVGDKYYYWIPALGVTGTPVDSFLEAHNDLELDYENVDPDYDLDEDE